MITNWPKVELDSTKAPIIPKNCPGCMEQATVEWRYGHKYPFSNTRYYQTFYYCDVCSDLISHRDKTKRLQFWLAVVALAAMIGLAVALAPATKPIVPGESGSTDPFLVVLIILAGVVPLAVYFLIGALRRKSKPVPLNVLGRTPTAYYTGKAFGGFGSKDVYRAQRQEWLDLLVKHNPESVTDQIYSERIAEPKPQKEKPF